MAIQCPYCEFGMELKGARAGRFSPRCQHCGNTFSLVISPDPAVAPVAAKIVSPPPAGPAPAPAPNQPFANGLPSIGSHFIITRKLAEGSTGPLYQATEVASDQQVAIKILADDLAGHPSFTARFTREAFATAQLSHPNLVSVLDIGLGGSNAFYSMELVESSVVSQTSGGRLDPQIAAAFGVQAARGLKYAHERGMIHRDVKPANLLVDDAGLVRVAELGLIRRPNDLESSGMNPHARRFQNTLANLAVGTPPYMAPEQAQDAAHVDSRADIYSLGCTIYDLLTGRPPYMGRTTIEILTKHQREPLIAPDQIVRTVPRTLSQIVTKMLAKRPAERYQSMTEVIRELEEFLGVSAGGPYAPRAELGTGIGEAARRFNRSGWAILKSQVLMGFFGACGVGAILALIFDRPNWLAGLVGLAVISTISYYVIVGVVQRTYLFLKLKELVLGATTLDWITWGILLGLAGVMLVASGWAIPWIGAAFVAVLLALGLHFTIDQMLLADRRRIVGEMNAMLRQFRERGVEESTLRQFVYSSAGERWEELYEAIFGYPAKLLARKSWSQPGVTRKKSARWQDPILAWAERKLSARRSARQREVIQRVEARAIQAEGKSPEEAQKLAKQTSQKIMEAARRLREGGMPRKPEPIPLPPHLAALMAPATASAGTAPVAAAASPPAPPPESIMNIINRVSSETIQDAADAEDDFVEGGQRPRKHLSWFQRRFGSPLDLIIGKQVRFILAAIILLGFGLWWRQNKVDPALQAAANVASTSRQVEIPDTLTEITRKDAVDIVIRSADNAIARSGSKELQIPYVNRTVRIALSSWNAGLAGLILLISVAAYGRLMSFTVILAAAVALVGHWFEIPQVGVPLPWMTAAAAAGLAFIALMFLRKPEF